ncbi:Double-stranded RNA-binding protein [Collichthys lucidus]|uniref:Double-stranded RNA-binding protein n=1 Tax=Collichthys lucidus TaxID=240159 RepID=A0A4V6ASC5_COLLU|nr:Double-stranded RNA-binding protein [Collichthys lucidus]
MMAGFSPQLQVYPFRTGSVSFVELPAPTIGCHGPHACLSYISSAATVKPLIYGCLSLVTTTTPKPPTDGLRLFTQGEKGPKLMKYNKQEAALSALKQLSEQGLDPVDGPIKVRPVNHVGGRTDTKQTNSGTTTQVCKDSKAVV